MKAIVLIPTRERKMKCTQFFPNEATSDKMAHSLFEAESTNRKKNIGCSVLTMFINRHYSPRC